MNTMPAYEAGIDMTSVEMTRGGAHARHQMTSEKPQRVSSACSDVDRVKRSTIGAMRLPSAWWHSTASRPSEDKATRALVR